MTEKTGDGPGSLAMSVFTSSRPVDPELLASMDNLVALAQHDALAGVSEVISERLDQVANHEYTIAHDAARWENGWLVMAALLRITSTYAGVLEGGSDYADAEEACREAAALLAAELDRLFVLLAPEPEPATAKAALK